MIRFALPLLLAFSAAACDANRAGAPIDAPDAPVAVRTIAELSAEPPTGPLPESCHSAYWPCVPRAQDVDCMGRGDGPVLIGGPVDIITSDPYGLDDDGDGVGCDP